MRATSLIGVSLCLLLCVGCDDDGGGDPSAGVTATRITAPEQAEFSQSVLQLTVEDTLTLSLIAVSEGGGSRDVTADAAWASADEGVLQITAPGALLAVGPGETEITTTFGELTTTLSVAVAPIAIESITLSPSDEQRLEIGESLQITATATLANGDEADVTERVEWASSDLDVAEVAGGLITLLSAGGADITASADGVSASVRVQSSCAYPAAPTDNTLQVGSVIPNLTWNGAYMSGGAVRDFTLEDVYCGAEGFEDVRSITFIIGAGWCSACHQFIPEFANQFHDPIQAEDGLIIFVETETANYDTATHAYANDEITRLIGPKDGIRIGDGQTLPTGDFFRTSPTITALPTQMVVRTSDMQIIASSAQSPGLLPFVQLAADPEADWSHLLPTPNCGPEDEEPSEPNNDASSAGPLTPGTLSGGVCDGQPDFFQIDEAGDYTLELSFSHSDADLDMAIWPSSADPTSDDPAAVSNGTSNSESISFSGPATLVVYSYSPAFSASYLLTLTPR